MAALAGFSLFLAISLIRGIPVGPFALSGAAQQQTQAAPEGAARQLFDSLNQARQQHGLSPLQWNDTLAHVALRHSQGMATAGNLTHELPGEPPVMQRLSVVPLDRSGENVANNTDFAKVHASFMASPPHRANILNPQYNEVGIGVVKQGDLYWVTEDFAHTIAQVSDSVAEQKVAQAFETMRRKARAPSLTESRSDALRRMACGMADQDRLNAAPALRLLHARNAVVYTSMDPTELPASVQRLRNVQGVDSYGVGACFKRTPQYPSGVYWVVLVLFENK